MRDLPRPAQFDSHMFYLFVPFRQTPLETNLQTCADLWLLMLVFAWCWYRFYSRTKVCLFIDWQSTQYTLQNIELALSPHLKLIKNFKNHNNISRLIYYPNREANWNLNLYRLSKQKIFEMSTFNLITLCIDTKKHFKQSLNLGFIRDRLHIK